jgi:hypothetical protein
MAKKKRVLRHWSDEDLRTLKSMAKAKTGVPKIAKKLKRTPAAIRLMASKLFMSLSVRD